MKKRILGLAICTVLYGMTWGYSKDRENAYKWAYSQGVTTMPTIEAANMNGNIKRAEMAKMVGQFIEHSDHIIAVQDLRQKCDFKDGKIGGDLQERIVTICQMGIMGQDGQGGTLTYFRPYDTVTRAEFGTLLSRVLRGDRYDGANPYYENHLTKLKLENIMVSIYNPQHIEKRGDIMEMLQKASALDISSNNNSKTTTITPKTEKEETENVFNILMGDNTSNTPSNTSTTEQKSDSTIPECAKNFDGAIVNGEKNPEANINGNVMYYNNKFGFCMKLGNLRKKSRIKTEKNKIQLINGRAADSYFEGATAEEIAEIKEELKKYGGAEAGAWYVISLTNLNREPEGIDYRVEVGRNNKYAITREIGNAGADEFFFDFHPNPANDGWKNDKEDGWYINNKNRYLGDTSTEWKFIKQWLEEHKSDYEPEIIPYNI